MEKLLDRYFPTYHSMVNKVQYLPFWFGVPSIKIIDLREIHCNICILVFEVSKPFTFYTSNVEMSVHSISFFSFRLSGIT